MPFGTQVTVYVVISNGRFRYEEADRRICEPVEIGAGRLRTGGPLLASDALELQHCPDAAIGFGKKYPEFWINKREAMVRVADDSGVHICLRAPDVPSVDAFHAAALKAGGASDGDPAVRMHYDEGYYAAFIRDPDGNRIEAVRFLRSRV